MTGFLDPCPLPMEQIYGAPITVPRVLAICFNLSRHFIPRDDCALGDIRGMIRTRSAVEIGRESMERAARKTLPRAQGLALPSPSSSCSGRGMKRQHLREL